MSKANKQWAENLLEEGYEVIDIGYPSVRRNLQVQVVQQTPLGYVRQKQGSSLAVKPVGLRIKQTAIGS